MRFLSCNGLFDKREVLWIRVVIISDNASSERIKPSRRLTNTFYLVQSFESVCIVLSSKFIFCLFALTTACNAVAKPTMWTDFSLSFIPSLMEQSFQLWPTPRSTAVLWQFLKASILKLERCIMKISDLGFPVHSVRLPSFYIDFATREIVSSLLYSSQGYFSRHGSKPARNVFIVLDLEGVTSVVD